MVCSFRILCSFNANLFYQVNLNSSGPKTNPRAMWTFEEPDKGAGVVPETKVPFGQEQHVPVGQERKVPVGYEHEASVGMED